MADSCCEDIVGGMIYIMAGSLRYEGTGDITIRPAHVERDAAATSGGRLAATERAMLAEAEFSFVNHCDADPMELFNGRCKLDIVIVEQSRNIRHYFNGAIMVGRPNINLSTGEFSGVRIVARSGTQGESRYMRDPPMPSVSDEAGNFTAV